MHSQLFNRKGILQAEMQHMLSLSEQFFKLPAEQKANFKFDLVRPKRLRASLCAQVVRCILSMCVLPKI